MGMTLSDAFMNANINKENNGPDTLANLNVKVGDVVLYAGNETYTVMPNKQLQWSNGEIHTYGGWYCCNNFTIVSRATAKPKVWKDMTPEEKGALLLVGDKGETIQILLSGAWYDCEPTWQPNTAYRVKPKPARISGSCEVDENGEVDLTTWETYNKKYMGSF